MPNFSVLCFELIVMDDSRFSWRLTHEITYGITYSKSHTLIVIDEKAVVSGVELALREGKRRARRVIRLCFFWASFVPKKACFYLSGRIRQKKCEQRRDPPSALLWGWLVTWISHALGLVITISV